MCMVIIDQTECNDSAPPTPAIPNILIANFLGWGRGPIIIKTNIDNCQKSNFKLFQGKRARRRRLKTLKMPASLRRAASAFSFSYLGSNRTQFGLKTHQHGLCSLWIEAVEPFLGQLDNPGWLFSVTDKLWRTCRTEHSTNQPFLYFGHFCDLRYRVL